MRDLPSAHCVPAKFMGATELDAVSRSGSSNSDKAERLNQDANMPENYLSPEVYALFAAAESSAARRADA